MKEINILKFELFKIKMSRLTKMVEYICPKCGKVFTQRSHYNKHLNRKTPCDKDKKKFDEVVKELSLIHI